MYAQSASLHIKSKQNEKCLKKLLNGSLEMYDRLQMGEDAEIECLDIASVSNTFVLFKHLCHLFAEQ